MEGPIFQRRPAAERADQAPPRPQLRPAKSRAARRRSFLRPSSVSLTRVDTIPEPEAERVRATGGAGIAASSGQLDTASSSVGRAMASPSRPLEPTVRQDMEQRFGHDFPWCGYIPTQKRQSQRGPWTHWPIPLDRISFSPRDITRTIRAKDPNYLLMNWPTSFSRNTEPIRHPVGKPARWSRTPTPRPRPSSKAGGPSMSLSPAGRGWPVRPGATSPGSPTPPRIVPRACSHAPNSWLSRERRSDARQQALAASLRRRPDRRV